MNDLGKYVEALKSFYANKVKTPNPCSCCGSEAKIEPFIVGGWLAESTHDFYCCSNEECEWYWDGTDKSTFTDFDPHTGMDTCGHRKKLWDYAMLFNNMADKARTIDGGLLGIWNGLHPKKVIPEKAYDPIGSLEV